MNFFKMFLIISVFTFLSCVKETQMSYEDEVVLIAYEINTPSRIWVKSISSEDIHEIVISKYRREPNINLNDTIKVKFFKDVSHKNISV